MKIFLRTFPKRPKLNGKKATLAPHHWRSGGSEARGRLRWSFQGRVASRRQVTNRQSTKVHDDINTQTMNGARHGPMSLDEVTQQAASAMAGASAALLVMQVPSGRIIAATRTAALLLDPQGGNVVGRQLEEFTGDEPSGALALFADDRVNGYEAPRTLTRRDETADLRVSLWYQRFDHQPRSLFTLVLITTGFPNDVETISVAPVVGTASISHLIEQISSGTVALFGQSADRLLGLSVSTLIEPADKEKWAAATDQASIGEDAVTVAVRTRRATTAPSTAGSPTACDVLLLPLRPGYTFVFLSKSDRTANSPAADGAQSMLMGLSRIVGLAQLERRRSTELKDRDLPGLNDLTPREQEMLTRLTAGHRVSGIAKDLVLSPSTVRTHLGSIFAKLGVSNQSDLLSAVRSSRSPGEWSELYLSWPDEP